MEDSLKVSYDEETGQVTLDWDPEDSQWSFLNGMTEEQLAAMLTSSARKIIEENETNA